MKTLDQIEARTIVNAANTPGDAANTYIISLPGSYYLTSNLAGDSGKHGVSIQASDVTLDLNGFAIVNITPGVGTVRGITVPADQKNVRVRNGIVRAWNDGGGRAETVRNARVESMQVSDCTGAVGVYVGLGSLIKDCTANANGTGFRTRPLPGDQLRFDGKHRRWFLMHCLRFISRLHVEPKRRLWLPSGRK